MKGALNHNWKGGDAVKNCKICGKEFHHRRTRLKAKYCSPKCASEGFKGTPAWNKGTAKISTENELVRKSVQYKLWRESVFTRDNYTCIWCLQKGGRLNADHIKPFAYFPELRFAIDNGRTLCEPCHRKTDTYGWGLYHKQKGHGKKS